MRKIIVFDFNRTIYDPERRQLLPDVNHVLKTAKERGYELHLISTANPSRAELIKSLGIAEYFMMVTITENKAKEFSLLAADNDIDKAASFVVGDRVRGEISYGNQAGLQTIWLRAGKFAEELPVLSHEKPRYVVEKLIEVLNILPLFSAENKRTH